MDSLTPERRSANMRAIRSKGMKPELLVRRIAHRLGYRFRLHRNDLPGKPDLAFIGRKKAIFVHGCFWHQHPDPHCSDARVPKSNLSYWIPKLERNVARDTIQRRALEEGGWKVLTVWDCETKDVVKLQQRIRTFLDSD
jgi:DNA mismatch endonuclease (patch repair protein)